MQNLDFKVAVPLVAFVLLAVGAFWYTSNGGFGGVSAEENLTGAVEYAGEAAPDVDVVWDDGQIMDDSVMDESVMEDEMMYDEGQEFME